MTEILNVTMTTQDQSDPRPQYFVKMCKDGSILECSLIPKGKEELDQCTMELEYIPQNPTEEEKLAYALTLPEVAGLPVSGELKTQIAQEMILKPDFVMPAFDPNFSRVHSNPNYFFETPCKPVIWCWKHGTEDEAKMESEAYRQKMLKKITVTDYPDPGVSEKRETCRWDMVVEVYDKQYNLVEV